MRMSGGRIVLLLLLCGAVSLADKSPKGKGSSPTTESPAVTGVSGVPATTPAASESSVLTTTGGVLSSSTPTEPTTAVEIVDCTNLAKNFPMDKKSICQGSTISIIDGDKVLDLSRANQKQVTLLFSLGHKTKALKNSLLLQNSEIDTLQFSIEPQISFTPEYVIKYNDNLRKVLLDSVTYTNVVHVTIIGNKFLTQDVIDEFKKKLNGKTKEGSYIQDAKECTMKGEDHLQNFDYLNGCMYFYKNLIITKDTQGTPPEKLPFWNISSGCVKIQGTALTNMNFLKPLTNIGCPNTDVNEITGNKDLCLNSETKDKLMKKLGSNTKIENNLDCDDECMAEWATKMRKDDKIRCRKIVGDLVVTGVKDVADLKYLSEVVEIEGSLELKINNVAEFPFLSKLKRIKHGSVMKPLIQISENDNLTRIDFSNLENVTAHDGIAWLVVEENTPNYLFKIDEAKHLNETFGTIRVHQERPNITVPAPEVDEDGGDEGGVGGVGSSSSGKGRTGTGKSGQKKDEGVHPGVIAGIVIGVIVGVILVVVGIVIVVVFMLKRKKKLTRAQKQELDAMNCQDYEKKAREAYQRAVKDRAKMEEPDAATKYQELQAEQQALKVTDLKTHFEEMTEAEEQYFEEKRKRFIEGQKFQSKYWRENTPFEKVETVKVEQNGTVINFRPKEYRLNDTMQSSSVKVYKMEYRGFLDTPPKHAKDNVEVFWAGYVYKQDAEHNNNENDEKKKDENPWDKFLKDKNFSWERCLEAHLNYRNIEDYPYEIILKALDYFLDAKFTYANSQLVRVEGCYHFVGDLYGSGIDLQTILNLDPLKVIHGVDDGNKKYSSTPALTQYKYIFCGNYMNGTVHDIQLMVTLLIFARLYKDRLSVEMENENEFPVVLLRGVHEIGKNAAEILEETLSNQCNFTGEQCSLLLAKFMRVYERLPTAALVNGNIFVVQGGFSRKVLDYPDLESAVNAIPMPLPKNLDKLTAEQSKLLDDFLYSEPGPVAHPISRYGAGCIFNERMMRQFLDKFNIQLVVRGRAENGFWHSMDKRLISLSGVTMPVMTNYDLNTILISPDLYDVLSKNGPTHEGAVLRLNPDGRLTMMMFRQDFPKEMFDKSRAEANAAANRAVNAVIHDLKLHETAKMELDSIQKKYEERWCKQINQFKIGYLEFTSAMYSRKLQSMKFETAFDLYTKCMPWVYDYDLALRNFGLYMFIRHGDKFRLPNAVEHLVQGDLDNRRLLKDKSHYWKEANKQWVGKDEEAKKEFAKNVRIMILTCERKRRGGTGELKDSEKELERDYMESKLFSSGRQVPDDFRLYLDEERKLYLPISGAAALGPKPKD